MGYKGRTIAILFVIICEFIFTFLDIQQHNQVTSFEISLTVLILIPMYFFGLQYDKARYYANELKDLFENNHIMLWKWESKTNSAIVSSGCEQIYGFSSKDFLNDGLLWLKAVYKKDTKIAQEFEKETLQGKSFSAQYRIVDQSGKIKWIQNMADPVFDKTGKFIKISGVTIDITKQKEQDINYKNLIEVSPIAMMILKNDEILNMNKEGLKLVGADSLEQVIGKKVNTFFPEEQQNINQLLLGEQDALPYHEYKLKRTNGSIVDVESTGIKTIYDDEETILVVLKNITKEKKMKLKLKEAEEKYRSISEESLVGVYIYADGKITYINKEVERILGYSREEVLEMDVLELFVEKQHALAANNIERLLNTETHSLTEDLLIKTKSGEIRDVEIRSVVTTFNNKKAIIGTIIDVTNEKRVENELNIVLQELQNMAFHDTLTGLLNRNSLNRYLEEQLQVLNPIKDSLSILFIDFDRFKNINDTLGHKYGDLMLQKASEILASCVNNKELVFRYGGDEFVIALNKTNASEAEIIAQNIIEKFSDSIFLDEIEVFTTPSIGISVFPHDGGNTEELIKAADLAMYFAKESGKNNYKFFNTSIGERINRSSVIERELRKALKEKQFILYFQPKIDLKTNQIIGYESLIRWNHPEMGMIPPNDFIPIAEETGLIAKLGEWVLEEACQKVQELGRQLPIAINISVKQFADVNFVKNTKEIIEKTHCHPSLLEFEITESIMQDVFSSIKIVKELKEMGIKISMDDFGTGYSNLSILNEMDLDILKIDRSFVKKMTDNEKSLSLVKTIITMGHSLGFEIVAEGIETLEQLELLKQFECDIGQGYYFNPPLPFNEIMKQDSFNT
ncbi:EAL domain-containing protein [Bacillus sp. BRMEA1]|uniref:GGDEF domain-containing phosphodiesterase n=1 Tax=Neobacillus endophyticus TaxID=2738405 RepID=UPI00156396ED|nr:GGDEF domain-containing phosphodiesterase [Neobacillus endophyticus]NRD76862.1 EAL domain-containing protein [Neobacillus endophyticus]